MKKMSTIVITLGLAVSLFSIANAGGMGGCDKCPQGGAPSAATEPFRTFQADTIDLRQEMMNKRFAIQRENLKGTPDAAKIAALNAEITAIQAKIMDIRSKSGLPADKCDGECPQGMGHHGKMGMGMNMGGCGKAMGGCNNGPCSGKK